MMTNLERSEMVQVKRPNKWGVVVISTENSQPTEEGQGKWQRFQSSWAAAVTVIVAPIHFLLPLSLSPFLLSYVLISFLTKQVMCNHDSSPLSRQPSHTQP